MSWRLWIRPLLHDAKIRAKNLNLGVIKLLMCSQVTRSAYAAKPTLPEPRKTWNTSTFVWKRGGLWPSGLVRFGPRNYEIYSLWTLGWFPGFLKSLQVYFRPWQAKNWSSTSVRELVHDVYFSHIFLSYGLLLLMLLAYLLNEGLCGPGPFYQRQKITREKKNPTLVKGERAFPPTKKNVMARTSSYRRKSDFLRVSLICQSLGTNDPDASPQEYGPKVGKTLAVKLEYKTVAFKSLGQPCQKKPTVAKCGGPANLPAKL